MADGSMSAGVSDVTVNDDGDVERRAWTPTAEQLAKYQAREAVLARHNVRILTERSPKRFMRKATNGCPEGEGYVGVALHTGGPVGDDCLHSPLVYGRALAEVRNGLR